MMLAIPEEIRFILYPLGFIATLAFALRFMIQWLQSEKAHNSIVTPTFWWLSIFGNVSLAVHTLIQGQYPICLIQGVNCAIAIRNLNLMQAPSKHWKIGFVIFLMVLALVIPTLLFFMFSAADWFRVPTHFLRPFSQPVSYFWHSLGAIGLILHSSRFWVQWVQAERTQTSSLELPFWWLSLMGAMFSLSYFVILMDYINLAGPLFGIIPYCRNLFLIYNRPK